MKKKIKKLVSSVLAFVIAFSALTIIPGNVLHAWYVSAAELVGGETGAEETYQSGSFTYTLVNEYTNVKLLSCSSDAEGLEIPDTIDGKYVTVLGGQTFQSNKTLKSVTLPKRLEVIEDAAFSGCTSLESVDFPSSLRSIGRNAFSGATALESITVDKDNPNYSDSDGVLMNKDKTALVLFPKSRQGQFIIPDTVTAIGDSTFDGCAGLTSVIVGDSVQTIGTRAFRSCSGLTEVTLGNGLTAIGNEAFYGCPKLQNEDFFVYNRIRSIKGDVNGDEEITISDVTLLQQYLADLETLDALGLAAADANGDGIINISDATHIQKYIAEIITEM